MNERAGLRSATEHRRTITDVHVSAMHTDEQSMLATRRKVQRYAKCVMHLRCLCCSCQIRVTVRSGSE